MSDYQKRLKRLIRLAKKAGWKVIKNGHVKFKTPEGRIVCCSWSPRSSSVYVKVCKDLRRAGLEI